jgi:hypothetical protein
VIHSLCASTLHKTFACTIQTVPRASCHAVNYTVPHVYKYGGPGPRRLRVAVHVRTNKVGGRCVYVHVDKFAAVERGSHSATASWRPHESTNSGASMSPQGVV